MQFIWTSFGIMAPPRVDNRYIYAANEQGDIRKMSKIIRSFKLTRDVKKNCYIKKNDFKLIRTKDSKKISKFSKIITKIVSNKISKNLRKGTYLSQNDFKKK